MNGDSILQEIISVQGRIESVVEKLEKNYDKIVEKNDTFLVGLQKCYDYMDQRRTLPEQIAEIRKIADDYEREKLVNAQFREEYGKKTDFLMTWYWRIAGATLALVAINTLLVLLGRIIDWEYLLKGP